MQLDLTQIKDLIFSPRNSSKGAVVKEAFSLFRALDFASSHDDLRKKVLDGDVFQKGSFETRKSIWKALRHRYLAVAPDWVAKSLVRSTEYGLQSSEFLSLSYLYYSLRDRLTLEFILGPVWEKWQNGVTTLDRSDFQVYLENLATDNFEIKKWHDSTKKKLASQALSALRDLGLLKGIQVKHIQRPTIASETVFHLLCILIAEGKEGRAIIESPEWRLFLWNEADISNALLTLAQKRWINFEKSGSTVILNLVRVPGETYEQ